METTMTATTGKPEPTGPDERQERRQGPIALDGQYGEIGISAVAAALRYAGDIKDPAQTLVAVELQGDERFVELAA